MTGDGDWRDRLEARRAAAERSASGQRPFVDPAVNPLLAERYGPVVREWQAARHEGPADPAALAALVDAMTDDRMPSGRLHVVRDEEAG